MHLVIYETTHHETLPSILDLSELYFEKVTVFLRELSYQNLSGENLPEKKWPHVVFIQQSSGSNRQFIDSAISYAKQHDCSHLHISTLDNNLLYFAWKLSGFNSLQISLSIQAVNQYYSFRCRDLRDISESLAKIFFHKRIKQYRVFFPLMKEVFEKKLSGVSAVYIPSRFFSGKKSSLSYDKFRIVIPGSVDQNRRDYKFANDFFQQYLPLVPSSNKIELIFLGKADEGFAVDFVASMCSLESHKFQIRYYTDYVSQMEYEEQLANSDIIWSPVHLNTKGIRGSAEVYGTSMATGLTADLLLTCKPALVPAGFQIPEHYHNTIFEYDSPNHLFELITQFMRNDNPSLEEEICNDLSYFNRENFKSSAKELFQIKD